VVEDFSSISRIKYNAASATGTTAKGDYIRIWRLESFVVGIEELIRVAIGLDASHI
jgi:hypothetical protein